MEKLSKEVVEFCATQYKKKNGCGTCFLHSVCAVSYLITRENIDNNVTTINNKFINFKQIKF